MWQLTVVRHENDIMATLIGWWHHDDAHSLTSDYDKLRKAADRINIIKNVPDNVKYSLTFKGKIYQQLH